MKEEENMIKSFVFDKIPRLSIKSLFNHLILKRLSREVYVLC